MSYGQNRCIDKINLTLSLSKQGRPCTKLGLFQIKNDKIITWVSRGHQTKKKKKKKKKKQSTKNKPKKKKKQNCHM